MLSSFHYKNTTAAVAGVTGQLPSLCVDPGSIVHSRFSCLYGLALCIVRSSYSALEQLNSNHIAWGDGHALRLYYGSDLKSSFKIHSLYFFK